MIAVDIEQEQDVQINIKHAFTKIDQSLDRTSKKYIFYPPARPAASSISLEVRKKKNVLRFAIFFSQSPPESWLLAKRDEMIDKGARGDFQTYNDFLDWRAEVMAEYRKKTGTEWPVTKA